MKAAGGLSVASAPGVGLVAFLLLAVAPPLSAQMRVTPAFQLPPDTIAYYRQAGRDAAKSYSGAGHGLAAFGAGAVLAFGLPLASAGDHWSASQVLIIGGAGVVLVGTVWHAWRGPATPPAASVALVAPPDSAARAAFFAGYRQAVLHKRRRALLWGPAGAVLGGAALIAIVIAALTSFD